VALQEMSSKVCTSSVKPVAVNDGVSKNVNEDCIDTLFTKTHCSQVVDTASETSLLPLSHSPAKCASNNDHGLTSSGSGPLSVSDVQRKAPELQSETFVTKANLQVNYLSSALAADMVNLYHNKVLSKNSLSVVSSSAANSTLEAVSNVSDVSAPLSHKMQLQKMCATKAPALSKSRFKLVKVRAGHPCQNRTVIPPLKQAVADIGRSRPVTFGEQNRCSVVTSSAFQLEGVARSAYVSSSRVVSSVSSKPKTFSVHSNSTHLTASSEIVQPNSNNSAAVMSSFCVSNANPDVGFTSSRYKLIRRKEPVCKNTWRQNSVTCLKHKDATSTPHVSHQPIKHTPTLLVMNKYKLIRKKRRSLTLTPKESPSDMKNLVPSMKFSRHVLSPFSSHSSVLTPRTRPSQYKLIRKNDRPDSTFAKKQPVSVSKRLSPICRSSNSKTRLSRYKLVRSHSTPARKPVASSNQTNRKAPVVSRYMLVRRKFSTLRTPQHVANSAQQVSPSTRIVCTKHITPPLFLNKYKLIRKRALLKTNSSCAKTLAFHSSRYVVCNSSNYSRKQLSLNRKGGTRSFLSKYALKRNVKGKKLLLDLTHYLWFIFLQFSC